MTTSLERRIEALEQAGGGRECPRCSDTTVVIVNDKLESVSRNGRLLTPEEAQEFVDEERDGRCPVCGATPTMVTVGGWGDSG